jgi:type II secretory pathway predicted ATPase ExeA
MDKKLTAQSLLAQFEATAVSYAAAAAEMNLPRSTLHMALHGRGQVNLKRVLPIVKTWLAGRRKQKFFKTAAMMKLVSRRGIALGEAAAATGIAADKLQKSLLAGEWESEAEYKKFQAFIDEKKYGEAKKMLTKISLPEDVLDYFGLKRDPFTNEMETGEDILDTKEMSRAEKKIVNAVEKGGWIAVTGPVGSGKSTLIKRVEAKLAKDKKVCIVKPRTIEKQFLGASHVCDSIIQDLGVTDLLNHRRTLEHKARLVGRVLEEAYKDNRRVIVLIDEAHLLRVDALLALKRIYEFEIGFKKLLSIVLVGQDFLAKNLKTNFQLSEVSQRVDLYELGSLNGSLGLYVRHKLERAGCGRELFDNSAFKAIGERFDTPLSVNNVAAAALLAAHDCGEKHVSAEIVRSIQGSY